MEAMILYAVFVYFWFHLVGRSDILAKPRAWFIGTVGPKISYPLECAFCWTWWLGLILSILPISFGVPVMAILFVAPVINLVLDLAIRKLRMDAEPPVLVPKSKIDVSDFLAQCRQDDIEVTLSKKLVQPTNHFELFHCNPRHPNSEKLPEPSHIGRKFRIKGLSEVHTVLDQWIDGDDCSGSFGSLKYGYRTDVGPKNTSCAATATNCELLPESGWKS